MSDTDRLAEIKARWAAATPSPWRWGDWTTTFGQPELDQTHLERSPAHGDFPALARLSDVETTEVLPALEDPIEPELEANAQAIVNAPADIDWLVGEVERLRGLLARLEWAGTTCYDAYGAEHTCPACRVQWDTAADFKGHIPGCWLAAELPTFPSEQRKTDGS
jgi:hypothetical protein